jgi:hypothetical protein
VAARTPVAPSSSLSSPRRFLETGSRHTHRSHSRAPSRHPDVWSDMTVPPFGMRGPAEQIYSGPSIRSVPPVTYRACGGLLVGLQPIGRGPGQRKECDSDQCRTHDGDGRDTQHEVSKPARQEARGRCHQPAISAPIAMDASEGQEKGSGCESQPDEAVLGRPLKNFIVYVSGRWRLSDRKVVDLGGRPVAKDRLKSDPFGGGDP